MRVVALVAALLIIGVGLVGLAEPEGFLAVAGSTLTPLGLLVVGALRLALGVVLMLVAPRSRAPRALRLLGLVIAIAGVVTPLVGVARARATFDWLAGLGPGGMRAAASLALAIGAFIVFAVAPRRAA